MPERKQLVRAVSVDYTCDTCLTGTMKYSQPEYEVSTGFVQKRSYRHICDNRDCNQLQDLPLIYPTIRYEPC